MREPLTIIYHCDAENCYSKTRVWEEDGKWAGRDLKCNMIFPSEYIASIWHWLQMMRLKKFILSFFYVPINIWNFAATPHIENCQQQNKVISRYSQKFHNFLRISPCVTSMFSIATYTHRPRPLSWAILCLWHVPLCLTSM